MQENIGLVREVVRMMAFLAALAPGSAWAAFDPPFALSRNGEYAARPRLAVNADGDGVVVWYRFDNTPQRVYARARSATGVLGPILTLSGGNTGSRYPDVAIDREGDAFVVWQAGETEQRILGRALSRTGVLGQVLTLSALHFALFPQVAVDDDGDALVVWSNSGRIHARAISKTGVVGPVQNISAVGEFASDPDVALDADGDAFVVWAVTAGGSMWVEGRARSRTGALGLAFEISAHGYTVHEPKVTMHRNGRALFSWVNVPVESQASWVQARRVNAAGQLGDIETLTVQGGFDHQVAVNALFDAFIVWADDRIRARSLSTAGPEGPILTLTSTTQSPALPQVALRGNGSALFVWQLNTSGLLQYRTRAAGGELGPVQPLSSVGRDAQIAIDGGGDVMVVWNRLFGSNDSRIQGRAEP